MKNTLMFVLVALSLSTATACSTASATPRSAVREARGEYLVAIMGCHDCHTPLKMGERGPEPDLSRALSGHPEQMGALPVSKLPAPWLWAGAPTNTAFNGPWGVSYAANITSDRNTGLGIWTEEMFVNALRTGKHMG